MQQTEITPELLEKNPLLAIYLIFVMGVILIAAVGSMISWIVVFYRRRESRPVLPMALPWEPRRWAFVDLLVLGFTFVAMQLVFSGLASKWFQLERNGKLSLELAAAGGLGSIVAVLFGGAWICLRYRIGPGHVGFGNLSPRILGVGLVGGLLGLPMLYVIMGVVSAISKVKYDHPLINSASDSGQFQTYLLGFFAAAIAAPIAEEFFFRVILQGWLQSIPFKSLSASFVGASYDNIANQPLEQELLPVGPEETASNDAEPNSIRDIYATNATGTSTAINPESSGAASVVSAVPPIWPSIVTGVLFGLAHIEYGLSFIPLSFLGIFLGYIYRQTHSVWPCIVIHMMLNSFSMMMLGLLILMKQAGVAVEQ